MSQCNANPLDVKSVVVLQLSYERLYLASRGLLKKTLSSFKRTMHCWDARSPEGANAIADKLLPVRDDRDA